MDTLPTQFNSIIPQSTIDSFTTLFVVSTIVSLIIFALVALFYIISAIRRWKVESAVFAIQKDLAQIKSSLAAQFVSTPAIVPAPQEESEPTLQPENPIQPRP